VQILKRGIGFAFAQDGVGTPKRQKKPRIIAANLRFGPSPFGCLSARARQATATTVNPSWKPKPSLYQNHRRAAVGK
jgi:hypothetical protein